MPIDSEMQALLWRLNAVDAGLKPGTLTARQKVALRCEIGEIRKFLKYVADHNRVVVYGDPTFSAGEPPYPPYTVEITPRGLGD